jgi:hypothetical protein
VNQFENAPEELKRLRQWHVWKHTDKTKIPVQVNGSAAKSNDPDTWTDFETAADCAPLFSGLAFEITEPYTGIDLDNCITEDGSFRDWAWPIIARLDGVAYAEISPSGTGVKFITRARKPEGFRCLHKINPGKADKQQIECYDHDRFWTITGDVYASQTVIADGQQVVNWICQTYLSGQQEKKGTVKHDAAPPRPEAQSLMQRAQKYAESVPGESKGNLRNAAFSLSGHLHSFVDDFHARLTDDEVYHILCDWNKKNNPPLRDEELKEASVNGRTNGTPREDKAPTALIQQSHIHVNLDAILNTREAASTAVEPFPIDCESLPGFLGDLIRHNLSTAHYPLPEVAMGAALSLLSTLTGGKVSDRGARTNLMIICLALSGAGKDHGRKLNRKILRLCGGEKLIGPERIGSHAGILSALSEQWNMLFQVDEIHHLAMAMQDRSSPHLVQISSVLMQVFSSADDIWTGDAYGDRAKVKTLRYPHLVLHGTAVPQDFWEAMTEKNLTGGLIGRCLVFESSKYVDYQEPSDEPLPQSLIDQAAWWLQLQTCTGNLVDQQNPDGAHPLKIQRDEAAHKRLHEHAIKISKRRMTEEPITAAIWSRAAEKTVKLAMLFACSRASGKYIPVIQLEDAELAIRMNNWITRRILQQADRHVSGSPFGQMVNEMRTLLRSRSGEWSMREITRKTQKLKPKDRMDILNTLLQSGCILQTERETAGRTAVVFQINE